MSNKVDYLQPLEFKWDHDTWVEAVPNSITPTEVSLYITEAVGMEFGSIRVEHGSNLLRNKKVSRAVPKDKRLDLTKPLEATEPDVERTYKVSYIGPVHYHSQNFMSWFICKLEGGISDDYKYFLMRGDGKTDIPGLTVRNKMVETKPKLVLPLKVGKKYRTRGQGDIILSYSDGPDGRCFDGVVIGTGEATAWYYLDGKAWKDREDSWDIVEGPL